MFLELSCGFNPLSLGKVKDDVDDDGDGDGDGGASKVFSILLWPMRVT